MKAWRVLRATTRWSDAASAAALALIGALIGFSSGSGSEAGLDAMRYVPLAAVPLLFRYQVSSAPAVMFWFDAARQDVPGATSASIRAEWLRLALFLFCFFAPLAGVGLVVAGSDVLRVLPAALGVALAAVGVGALFAVMPYRWMPAMMVLVVGLVIAIILGWIPLEGGFPLTVGVAAFGAACALLARQLAALLRQGVDPAVGGDYAYAFSFGRHGSFFQAPNSWPFVVLLGEWRRHRGSRIGAPVASTPIGRLDVDARVCALLGEMPWQASVAPLRHALFWLGSILLYPLLMLGLFATLDVARGATREFIGEAGILSLVLLAYWAFVMGISIHGLYGRALRDPRCRADLVVELRLLPRVVAPARQWNRRLRRLWLPAGAALGGGVFLVAWAIGLGVQSLAHIVLVYALLVALFRVSIHVDLRADRWGRRVVYLGLLALGLLLLAGVPLWMFDQFPEMAAEPSSWFFGVPADAAPMLAFAPALPVVLLLALATWRLRRADGVGLVLGGCGG